MKREEKDELLRQINEQQLNLLSIMAKSDAHASKCAKLSLTFADEYPDEYKEYCSARIQYNANQERIIELENTLIDEEHHVIFDNKDRLLN